MRQLFEIDLGDYSETTKVFSRPSARGIIFDGEGRLALVYSKKEHYYKFPGGGIHDDERKEDALIREVAEESGLQVVPESIREFGSVMRRQRSNYKPDTMFQQENFYYFCKVSENVGNQNLDPYEADLEFTLRFVPIDEAIRVNDEYTSDDSFNTIMIKREMRVLEMIKDELTGA